MRHLPALLLLLLATALGGCAYQTLAGPGHPPRVNADDELGPFN